MTVTEGTETPTEEAETTEPEAENTEDERTPETSVLYITSPKEQLHFRFREVRFHFREVRPLPWWSVSASVVVRFYFRGGPFLLPWWSASASVCFLLRLRFVRRSFRSTR